MIERAKEADPKNVLPIYQKAQIMVSLERYDLALEELHQLEGLVPKESTIFALMGKIYKHLNMHHKAMFYFGVALDLKPPAADVAAIKVPTSFVSDTFLNLPNKNCIGITFYSI